MQTAQQRLTLLVFTLTLFLSAALMFAIQPMIGKMLLPLVGGTPAGWIVAMAFFQMMLLAGYLIAHIFSKASARAHGIYYLALIACGVAFLPLSLTAQEARLSSSIGPADIFILLTATVALPFIALSATSSTLQRLFTVTSHQSSADPYFLYAASNAGSFAGLLLYPICIEPVLKISQQSEYMFYLYALLLLAGACCLLLSFSGAEKTSETPSAEKAGPTPWAKYAEWAALAFFPSSLLLGVTTHITTDLVSVPLIWVIPLALYLLTFIMAFSRKPLCSLETLENLFPFFTLLCVIFISFWINSWASMFFSLIGFFFIALALHTRLASLRPLDSERHRLTAFYLMISVGGALGGLLNAFIAPHLFNSVVEYPLVLLALFFVFPILRTQIRRAYCYAALYVLCLMMVNLTSIEHILQAELAQKVMLGICGAGLFIGLIKPRVLQYSNIALLSIIIFMTSYFLVQGENQLYKARNFYGAISVFEKTIKLGGKEYPLRTLQHGSTTHGTQIFHDLYKTTITSYYTRSGPLGDIFAAFKPKDVAVIGMGAASTNCYKAKDRRFTFFEIDQGIYDAARQYFTYLEDCKTTNSPTVIIGDGRLEIAKQPDHTYDLIIVDAFTSDSIPVHLITKEALAIYQSKLRPGGVIALHISNRYFKLWAPIGTTAQPLGLTAMRGFETETDDYASGSLWLTLTDESVSLKDLPQPRWQPVSIPPEQEVWTDDYSNVLGTLWFIHKSL